jgi:hypothetical protein
MRTWPDTKGTNGCFVRPNELKISRVSIVGRRALV